MLDWNRIRELRSEVGDDEFRLILELFLDEVESVIMRLSSQPGPQLASQLHFLKGCARNLGFQQFARLCDEGEAEAIASGVGRVDIDALLGAYAASKALMIAGIAREFGPPAARLA
ncbi:Hpt domain-containing protein [Paracoccus yeei]|uniref:Hpt domain-containing protein n=1 Tax=Paracoccus yeei TaxID=147645 RepID=UPI003BF83E59